MGINWFIFFGNRESFGEVLFRRDDSDSSHVNLENVGKCSDKFDLISFDLEAVEVEFDGFAEGIGLDLDDCNILTVAKCVKCTDVQEILSFVLQIGEVKDLVGIDDFSGVTDGLCGLGQVVGSEAFAGGVEEFEVFALFS